MSTPDPTAEWEKDMAMSWEEASAHNVVGDLMNRPFGTVQKAPQDVHNDWLQGKDDPNYWIDRLGALAAAVGPAKAVLAAQAHDMQMQGKVKGN